MKRSNRLVLLIGIFLALVVFALILFTLPNGLGSSKASPTPATTTQVVVATAAIDLGATVTQEMVTLQDMAIADKPANAYGDPALVVGQIARQPITDGQLIVSTMFSDSGSVNNISVPPGFVAMAVQVDQVTGVGTIIKPGDFVDVISGFTSVEKWPLVVANPDPEALPGAQFAPQPLGYPTTSVKVLSQGLQVLGTLLPPPPQQQAAASPGASADTGTTLNGQQQIVILSVPMQDAEVIKFSQMDGNISLVLRSSKDCVTDPDDGQPYCPVLTTSGITLRKLVDGYGVLPPQIIQVIDPTPYPGNRLPVVSPRPSPSVAPSVSPSATP